MSIHLVNQAPEGTKLWLLHLGDLEADVGFFMRGAGASTKSSPDAPRLRGKGVIISALIEHPTEGLILFETGAGPDYPEVWGPPLNDLFARVNYTPDQELDKAIEKTGHNIKDVKAVIMGHLHLDHAGGLTYFRGTDVPIYVHELELKHAFYSVLTKTDFGVYIPQNLHMDLNWKAFHGNFLEFAPGINLIHAPGHTPGLTMMQLNLHKSGPWLFTTDQYHVHQNYEDDVPQGWLARDHDDWDRTHQTVKSIVKNTGAKLVFGHDEKQFFSFKHAPEFYE